MSSTFLFCFFSSLFLQIGSFFMINLCLVVIATQFSETKKREMERMRQERARFTSSSTLASSTNNSEPTTCYAEIVKYIGHLYRRLKRRLIKKLRLYKYAFYNWFVLLLWFWLHLNYEYFLVLSQRLGVFSKFSR